MGTVRIAHISDLHFGATLQQGTWGVLKAHLGGLAAEGQLHLVLVTGDVVNTPKNSLFKQASDALESLGVDYLVCSGNHDRHPLGNSWKAVRFINWAARRAANFSDHFVGKIPTLKDFRDVPLQSEEDHWLLRIASVDSSLKADISARGYVELPLNHLAAAMSNSDEVDLGIILIHHHLMPVRVLEANREQRRVKLGGLTRLTALVNAGTVTEALAQAHFDLALHGHEHSANWARYGTLEDDSQMVVLGAASATGAITFAPCDPKRMSYNIINLRPDRSVQVFVMHHEGDGTWRHSAGFEIMSAEDSGRQRFLRRAKNQAQAEEMVKVIEFARNGDGNVNQYQTDWSPEQTKQGPLWRLTAINSTGEPTDLYVLFVASDGQWTDLRPAFHPEKDQDHAWMASCLLESDFFKGYRTPGVEESYRLEESYRWKQGGILTSEQMDKLLRERAASLGPIRREGREFGAISIRRWFKSATLLIRLPPDLAPDPSTLEAFIRKIGTPDRPEPLQAEVVRGLRILGEGLFSLTIAYPRKGYRYGLSWRPANATTRGRTTDLPAPG